MSDNQPPKLLNSDPIHVKYKTHYGGKYPRKGVWLEKFEQKENPMNSPETDVSTIETSTETSTSVSQNQSKTFPDSQFVKDVPDSQLDFLPEPRKDNTPEPNDGPLPEIKQPYDVTDEIDARMRVADYEEEEDGEEMDELEAYNFIKDHPAFFEYEIKELIVRHYERTCIYSISALDRMTQNQKIRYIKTHHPEWYAAAYEAALRDMSIKRNNHPTRW